MSGYRKPDVKKLQAEVDAFDAKCPVGGRVAVNIDGADAPLETLTTTKAEILSGHSAVVWLKGVSGCYLLSHVTPLMVPA